MNTLVTPVALLAPFLDTLDHQGQHLGEAILDQPAISVVFLLEVLDDTTDGGFALSRAWRIFPRRRKAPSTETPSRSTTVTTRKSFSVPLDLVTEKTFIVSPRDTASPPEGSSVCFVLAPSLVIKVPTNIGTGNADAPPALGRPLAPPTA